MRALGNYIGGLISGVILAVCIPAMAEKQTDRQPIPLVNLQALTEIWNKIKAEYVDVVDDERMMRGCIAGMAALDAQSNYMDEAEFKLMHTSPLAGIGIELTIRNGHPVVVSPIDNGPALKAGIQPGDILLTIDGEPTAGLELTDVVDKLHGEAKTEVVVTLWRNGLLKPLEKQMTRETINVPSAIVKKLDGNLLYLRLSSFTSTSAKTIAKAIDGTVSSAKPSGLIVDLRNNPGGVVKGVVDVADLFIHKGTIMSIAGRSPDAIRTFSADGTAPYAGIPTVVLVNYGTAAASEILAESLRVHGNAKILGNTTFGAGTIQTIFPMVNDTAIKITTGRWKTARGEVLEGKGLEPDIEMPNADEVFQIGSTTDPWLLRAERELAAQP